jgi:hypothetical protein
MAFVRFRHLLLRKPDDAGKAMAVAGIVIGMKSANSQGVVHPGLMLVKS